jgi:hypothetical protein
MANLFIVGGVPLTAARLRTIMASAGGGGTDPNGYSNQEIADRNAAALSRSLAVISRGDTVSARLIWDYIHFLTWGQSNSTGQEGFPRLFKAQPYNDLMVGASVRPSDNTTNSSSWAPQQVNALTPLVATHNRGTGDHSEGPFDDDWAYNQPVGSLAWGESTLETCLSDLKRLWAMHRAVLDPKTLPPFIGSVVGLGGKTIAQLSKGYVPHHYKRMLDIAPATMPLIPAGKTYGIGPIMFMHGESDSIAGTDPAVYKAMVNQNFDDISDDVIKGIVHQDLPPAIFSYQVSASWTREGNHIAMAHIDLANERPGFHLIGPMYQVTDKGGHLDTNGHRMLGALFAKVIYRVLIRGEGWKALQPTKLTWRARQVLIDYHVPAPPLKWGLPYVLSTPTMIANHGFALFDASGSVPIENVEIVADAVVRVVAARDLVAPVRLEMGNKGTHNGATELQDSDDFVTTAKYDVAPGYTKYPDALLPPERLGKPYALNNWSLIGNWPVVADPAT